MGTHFLDNLVTILEQITHSLVTLFLTIDTKVTDLFYAIMGQAPKKALSLLIYYSLGVLYWMIAWGLILLIVYLVTFVITQFITKILRMIGRKNQ